jgi:hypothetical protein
VDLSQEELHAVYRQENQKWLDKQDQSSYCGSSTELDVLRALIAATPEEKAVLKVQLQQLNEMQQKRKRESADAQVWYDRFTQFVQSCGIVFEKSLQSTMQDRFDEIERFLDDSKTPEQLQKMFDDVLEKMLTHRANAVNNNNCYYDMRVLGNIRHAMNLSPEVKYQLRTMIREYPNVVCRMPYMRQDITPPKEIMRTLMQFGLSRNSAQYALLW